MFFNEGSGKQTTFLSMEGAVHDSNAVWSELNYYLSTVCLHSGNEVDVYVHMDSCAGQNKNNIILFHSYFMLRVLNECYRSVTLEYMTFGHTIFSPDRIFGHMKQRLKVGQTLSGRYFADEIVEIATPASHAVVLDHVMRTKDYKKGTEHIFHRLEGFKSSCITLYSILLITQSQIILLFKPLPFLMDPFQQVSNY